MSYSKLSVISYHVAEGLFRAILSIFGMRRKLSEALRIINCFRALARVFMIQRNEADVPEMLTEPGKWPDGDTSLLKGSSEMDIILYETNRLACGGARPEYRPNAGFL
jgi:hypothetical protein